MEKGQSDENETQLFCCLCGFGTKPLPPANHKRGGKGMGDGLIPVGHPSPKGLIHTDSLDPSRWAALPLPTLGSHTRGSRIRRKRHLSLQDLIGNLIGHAAASCEPVLGPSNEELRGVGQPYLVLHSGFSGKFIQPCDECASIFTRYVGTCRMALAHSFIDPSRADR